MDIASFTWGIRNTDAVNIPNMTMNRYINLVITDVTLLGQHAQQKEHAAEAQQHAT